MSVAVYVPFVLGQNDEFVLNEVVDEIPGNFFLSQRVPVEGTNGCCRLDWLIVRGPPV